MVGCLVNYGGPTGPSHSFNANTFCVDSSWSYPSTPVHSPSEVIGNCRPIVQSANTSFNYPNNQQSRILPQQPSCAPFQRYYGHDPWQKNFPYNPQQQPQLPTPYAIGSERFRPEMQQKQVPPPPGFSKISPDLNNNTAGQSQTVLPMRLPTINDLAAELDRVSMSPSPTVDSQTPWSTSTMTWEDTSDSDDDSSLSHPNKYPVEIEYHDNKYCNYQRQATMSGEKVKQKLVTSHDPITLHPETSLQQTKYYQKHLVRICRCGKYQQMEGALQQGRANDCSGYEIHYSQKCKWKAYDDFRTGKRVLVRLCKCYKPM